MDCENCAGNVVGALMSLGALAWGAAVIHSYDGPTGDSCSAVHGSVCFLIVTWVLGFLSFLSSMCNDGRPIDCLFVVFLVFLMAGLIWTLVLREVDGRCEDVDGMTWGYLTAHFYLMCVFGIAVPPIGAVANIVIKK